MSSGLAYWRTWLRFRYGAIATTVIIWVGWLLPRQQISDEDLTGKIAIVTGANSGIGLSLARSLARAGATVYLACRSLQKGQDAATEIIDSLADGIGSSKRVHVVQLDTSSLDSVRALAKSWSEGGKKIDILFYNAGISGLPDDKVVTSDNLGVMYATNHAGPFLLTSLLEKYLAKDARVLFTSSAAQYGGNLMNMVTMPRYLPQPGVKYPSWYKTYADTKSMQTVFAKLLQDRFIRQAATDGNTRISHAFSPGYTQSAIFGKMDEKVFDPVWWTLRLLSFTATPSDVGASTGYWLASTSDPAVTTPANGGKQWERKTAYTSGVDMALANYGYGFLERLWELWTLDTGASWA